MAAAIGAPNPKTKKSGLSIPSLFLSQFNVARTALRRCRRLRTRLKRRQWRRTRPSESPTS
jgi:hypothetical protein